MCQHDDDDGAMPAGADQPPVDPMQFDIKSILKGSYPASTAQVWVCEIGGGDEACVCRRGGGGGTCICLDGDVCVCVCTFMHARLLVWVGLQTTETSYTCRRFLDDEIPSASMGLQHLQK